MHLEPGTFPTSFLSESLVLPLVGGGRVFLEGSSIVSLVEHTDGTSEVSVSHGLEVRTWSVALDAQGIQAEVDKLRDQIQREREKRTKSNMEKLRQRLIASGHPNPDAAIRAAFPTEDDFDDAIRAAFPTEDDIMVPGDQFGPDISGGQFGIPMIPFRRQTPPGFPKR